jgi:hypothetical protein
MKPQQPETPAPRDAVRAIIEWCGTTDPAHTLAATLTGVYQPLINSMDDVAALPAGAVVRDNAGDVLELVSERDSWFMTGREDAVLLESIEFPARVLHLPEAAA